MVSGSSNGRNLFQVAYYHNWRTSSWISLIDMMREASIAKTEISKGFACYLSERTLCPDVLKAFIKAGANPLQTSHIQNRTLFQIANHQHWEKWRWLWLIQLMKESSISPQAISEGFALYLSGQQHSLQVIRAFIKAGANPHAVRDRYNRTVFDIAEQTRWPEASWSSLLEICSENGKPYENISHATPLPLAEQLAEVEIKDLADKSNNLPVATPITLATAEAFFAPQRTRVEPVIAIPIANNQSSFRF
jgi:hypothetical protein